MGQFPNENLNGYKNTIRQSQHERQCEMEIGQHYSVLVPYRGRFKTCARRGMEVIIMKQFSYLTNYVVYKKHKAK